jgi:RNA polymerase sigma-70 factor, ECF subfamily
MAKGTTEKIYTEWLVLRCQDCDKTAFYELYKLWAIRFETYVRKLSRSGDHTPDILQDGWIAISKNIRKLNDPTFFKPWAYRIMTNKVRDWQRKQIRYEKSHVAQENDQIDLLVISTPDKKDETALIKNAVIQLNCDQQQLIKLYYYEQLSINEIAIEMNIAQGTVKSRLYNVRCVLKEILKRIEYDRN